MNENTDWAAPDLPDLGVEHRGFDWPAGGADPFDPRHPTADRLYWARGKPSRLLPADACPDRDELNQAIPMGYATLTLLERVAIVADGQRLRTWRHETRLAMSGPLQPYQYVLPPSGSAGYLALGAIWPFRWTLAEAVELSARTRGPVLICRVLESLAWH